MKKIQPFLNMNMRKRILIFFLFLSLIPTIVVGFASLGITRRELVKQSFQSGIEITDRMIAELDTRLSEIDNLFQVVTDTPALQTAMRQVFDGKQEQYSVDLKISSDLSVISQYNSDISGVYVIGENGGIYKSNNNSLNALDLRDRDWYREVLSSGETISFSPHRYSYVVKTVDSGYLSFGRAFVDIASGRRTGIILIELEQSIFSSIIDRWKDLGFVAICDQNGSPVLSSDSARNSPEIISSLKSMEFLPLQESTLASYLPDRSSTYSMNAASDNSYIVIQKALPWCGWTLYSAISTDHLNASGLKITSAILLISAITGILCIFCSMLISDTITRPLGKLVALIGQVKQGNFQVQMPIRGKDEISTLGRHFNDMIHHIQRLLEEIREGSQKLRKSELAALQAQIAPHFLYNTLDSIIWLIRSGQRQQAIEMTRALSGFFRLGISRGYDIISLRDELEHVKNYLIIQKIRYDEKFSYTIQADPDILDCYVLKLILQPLVENAIYHGIKPTDRVCRIDISAGKQEDWILLKVRDNGRGMTEEEFSRLKADLESPGPSQSYGLKNVKLRLDIFFEEQCSLNIQSGYGTGTEITIRIPRHFHPANPV